MFAEYFMRKAAMAIIARTSQERMDFVRRLRRSVLARSSRPRQVEGLLVCTDLLGDMRRVESGSDSIRSISTPGLSELADETRALYHQAYNDYVDERQGRSN